MMDDLNRKKPGLVWRFVRGLFLFVGIFVVGIIVLGLIFGGDKEAPRSSVSGAAAPTRALEAVAPVIPVPDLQKRFVAAVESARATYAAGANDMAKGAARPQRAKAICEILKSRNVKDWVGTIDTLSTNSDGLGVLKVAIGPRVTVGTWNNSLSDFQTKTLIDADSPVFKTASSLARGAEVIFSGTLFRSDTDCVTEGSLTLRGSISEPAFILRFSELRPTR